MKITPGIHIYKAAGGQLDTNTRTYEAIVASDGPVDRGSKRNCITNPNAGSIWKWKFTRNAEIPPALIIELDRLKRLRDPADLRARLDLIGNMLRQPGFDPNARIAIHNQGTALHVAAKAYDVQASQVEPTGLMDTMLGNAHFDLTALDAERQTVLHTAARAGSVEAMRVLLSMVPNLHSQRDKHGRTPFAVAVFDGGEKAQGVKNLFYDDPLIGHEYISWQPRVLREVILNPYRFTLADVKRLLKNRNVDLNHKFDDDGGKTLFHVAVLAYARAVDNGMQNDAPFRRQVLDLLVRNPLIDRNAGDNQGRTVLHHLLGSFRSTICGEILELLLMDRRFDLNKRDNENKTPLLHAASVYGRPESLAIIRQLLYLENAQHDAVDSQGRTLVHHVAMRNVPLLNDLSRINDVLLDNQDEDGATPIHHAIENINIRFVEFALQRLGPDSFNRPRNDGKTPFHLAVIQNNRNLLEILLAVDDIQVNAADHAGSTPLDHALDRRLADVLDILIADYRVAVNYVRSDGNTVLQTLLLQRLTEHAALLLSTRSDFARNQRGANGQTALHTAVACRDENIVQELLKQPGIIALTDKNQQNALHVAAQSPSYAVARLLLQFIKNNHLPEVLKKKDNDGNTALMLARKADNSFDNPFIKALAEVFPPPKPREPQSGPSRPEPKTEHRDKSKQNAGSSHHTDAPGGSNTKSAGDTFSFDDHDFNAEMNLKLALEILGIPMPTEGLTSTSQVDEFAARVSSAGRKLVFPHHPDKLKQNPILLAGKTEEWHGNVVLRINQAVDYIQQALDPIRERFKENK